MYLWHYLWNFAIIGKHELKRRITMSTWTLKEKSMGDMNVTIEGEEWKNAVKKAFNKIAKNAKIDGFRKGHVPAAMLEKKVSMAERQAQAIEDNANEWMRKAFEELNLTPKIGRAHV